jgi:hypothetical protein
MGNGDGTFGSPATYPTGVYPWGIVSCDFDGDGYMDLATSNYTSEDVSILMNDGDGTFTPDTTYAVGTDPHAILNADLNGDGAADLVTTNLYSYDVSVLINNGDGTFADEVRYDVTNGPIAVDAADLDEDGDLDLFVACYFIHKIAILYNNGDGTFAPCVLIDNSGGPFSVAAVDLDDDGDLDIAAANRSSDDVSVHINECCGAFAAPVYYDVGQDPYYVTAADLDGDGDADLVAANLDWNSVSVLINDSDGTFASQVTYPVGSGPLWVIDADFNNDGRLDLAVANCFSDNISILLNEYSPDAPILISPIDGFSTYSHSITLDWADYAGALTYEVVVDNDPQFGSIDRSQVGLIPSQWHITPDLGHGTWYWKVRANTASGPSDWSYTWRFVIRQEIDPSCPVLFTHDGNGFIQENPLLTACEKSGYVDVVTDFYQVTNSEIPDNNVVTFQLRELEDETTFLYDIELITVDHSSESYVACDANGQISTYRILNAPLSAIDHNGVDRLQEIISKDGIWFKSYETGHMDIVFVTPEDGSGLIFEAPPKKLCPDEDPIDPKVNPADLTGPTQIDMTITYQNSRGEWIELSDIPTRDQIVRSYVYSDQLDVESETVTFRLAWERSYAADAILQFVPSEENPETRTYSIASAHFIMADGEQQNTAAPDGSLPLKLVNGDVFEFGFVTEGVSIPGVTRDYIVRAVGRYQPDYSVFSHLLPAEVKLYDNYPNPFNPMTTLSYDLPAASHVKLDIYNVLGQHISTLVDMTQEAGRHQVIWDGTDLNGNPVASGVYVYRLTGDSNVKTRKMVLLK